MAADAPDVALDLFNRALQLLRGDTAAVPVLRSDVSHRLGVASRTTGRFAYRPHLEEAARLALFEGRPVAAEAMLEDRGSPFASGGIAPERRAIQDQLAECASSPPVMGRRCWARGTTRGGRAMSRRRR
ncbi:MAG: hypothetical protein Q8K58_07240 [Acidimicrobiales bacterium]|nr:hypothetical protein [Acidimicrobiales bacterium]